MAKMFPRILSGTIQPLPPEVHPAELRGVCAACVDILHRKVLSSVDDGTPCCRWRVSCMRKAVRQHEEVVRKSAKPAKSG
jgi:hypothetical protein